MSGTHGDKQNLRSKYCNKIGAPCLWDAKQMWEDETVCKTNTKSKSIIPRENTNQYR
jgi:hypothetical protein